MRRKFIKAPPPPTTDRIGWMAYLLRFTVEADPPSNVAVSGKCLIWQRSCDKYGYGYVFADRKIQKIHRVAWAIFGSGLPPGTEVCHECDTPACCNPLHLFAGTHKQNMRQAFDRGLVPLHDLRGEKNGGARLTDDAVRELRRLRGTATMRELAARFGVSESVASRAASGRGWKHVT